MKTKITKKQLKIKQQQRRAHERVGALVLMSAILVGAVSVSHEARSVLKEATLRPAIAVLNNCGRENETTRMPVRYDNNMLIQTIGGR